MRHRSNFYSGQLVKEDELDTIYDDAEQAEQDLASDGAILTGAIGGSPGADAYGGILNGLVIGGTAGDEEVTVALGVARDNLGQRIRVPSQATVKLTKTGTTVVGTLASAEGDGAAIAGGACSAGKYIVIGLYLLYDQLSTNAKTDSGGASVYYDIDESFKFELKVNVEFTCTGGSPPGTPGAPSTVPTRPALENGKVLLADVIAYNNAGTMQLVAIMATTPQWRALATSAGDNYKTLTGRTAQWLTVTNGDEFESSDAATDVVRADSAREALYQLAKRVKSCAVSSDRPKGAPTLVFRRDKYGMPIYANEFYDRMRYINACDHPNAVVGWNWGMTALGGGSLDAAGNGCAGDLLGAPLNYLQVGTSTTLNEGLGLTAAQVFDLGVAPFAMCLLRFSVGSLTNTNFAFGLRKTFTNFNSSACIIMTTDGAGVLSGRVVNSAGGVGTQPSLGAIVANTVYTARIVVTANNEAWFQLNNGTWQQSIASGSMATGNAYFSVQLTNLLGGARRYAYLYQAYASDGALSADMAP